MGGVGRAVPEPSIDALLACAEAAYAAAKAAAATAIAAAALEAEDERLIASPEACGLLTLFLVQSLETKAAKGLGQVPGNAGHGEFDLGNGRLHLVAVCGCGPPSDPRKA